MIRSDRAELETPACDENSFFSKLLKYGERRRGGKKEVLGKVSIEGFNFLKQNFKINSVI